MARIDEVISGEKSVWKYALDVLGHAGLGAAYSLPFIAWGVLASTWGFGFSMVAGIPIAFLGGLLRENYQFKKSGKLHLLDRVLDSAHHVLGPPIAWGLVTVVQTLT